MMPMPRAHSKEQQLRALKAEWTVLSNHDAKIQEELVEKESYGERSPKGALAIVCQFYHAVCQR